ncbi:MAG: HTH domain-containing protein [Bauldia sp.]
MRGIVRLGTLSGRGECRATLSLAPKAAMDKTERLFSVMDALRRHRRPVTAAELAAEQSVSVRTLYRDVQTLIGRDGRRPSRAA